MGNLVIVTGFSKNRLFEKANDLAEQYKFRRPYNVDSEIAYIIKGSEKGIKIAKENVTLGSNVVLVARKHKLLQVLKNIGDFNYFLFDSDIKL